MSIFASLTHVRISDHEKSPRLASSPRAISAASYFVLPKSSFKRAMRFGILNRRVFGLTGESRANGFPILVISTDSPSAIHEATRAKRFRKSLTEAVFIVIQAGLTFQ